MFFKGTCPALQPTDTYDVSCSYRNGPGNCSAPIQGTIADIKCKAFYVRQDWVIPSCQDGHWDPTPQPCNPGQIIAQPSQIPLSLIHLIFGRPQVTLNETNWLKYNVNPYDNKEIDVRR